MSPRIFICGITGIQGGSIASHLLSKSIPIAGLARNPSSATAQALISRGANLTPGSYEDSAALTTALQGCTGIFLNLMPSFTDPTAELQQAKHLIAAAKATGTVTHIVYSSALSINNPEKLTHWDPDAYFGKIFLGKQAIEAEVRAAGFAHWTILRPGNFMTNYLDPYVRMLNPGLVETGSWTTAYKPDTVLPMVDTDTIGAFGAAALLEPERFDGKDVEIVDEFMLLDEVFGLLEKKTGRTLKAEYLTDEEIEKKKEGDLFMVTQLVTRDIAKFVDLDKVKSWEIPLGTFAAFLDREIDRVQATYTQDK